MSNEDIEALLSELREWQDAVRECLNGLENAAIAIDRNLVRLAELRAELSLAILSDVAMRETNSSASGETEIAACIRLPFGLGVAVWREADRKVVQQKRGAGLRSESPSFLRFVDVPPLIRRLLIPHLEQLLSAIQQRLSS